MTKEPIMIDEVDVSGCVYRAEEKCILKDDGCCFFPNCGYKNWQRKEKEFEKLKEENKLAKEIITKAVVDFSIEYGTKQYRRLLNGAKLLGIEVQDDR